MSDEQPLGHPDARLVELLAQTDALRAAEPAAIRTIADRLRVATTPDPWPGPPITVDSLLRNPACIARHLDALSEQRLVLAELTPPGPPLTRRQRARRRVDATLTEVRERLALRIAPWLKGNR